MDLLRIKITNLENGLKNIYIEEENNNEIMYDKIKET